MNREIDGQELYESLLETSEPVAQEVQAIRVYQEQCPDCGNSALSHQEGCLLCRSCGWSACGA